MCIINTEALLTWKSSEYYVMWVCAWILALFVQHVKGICGLSDYTMLFHTILPTARFSGEKKYIDRKLCILIFSKTFSDKYFYF